MTDHIRTDTVNFKDWVLGRGYFSEENLAKARKEFFTKLGKHWNDRMLASMEKAFSDHDAVPEAKADLPDERPPNAVSANGGTPGAASRDGSGTGNTPTLTEEERGAIEWYANFPDGIHADTLRKLLERLK